MPIDPFSGGKRRFESLDRGFNSLARGIRQRATAADSSRMSNSSRWKLVLLTILVIALSVALARFGHPPFTGMWDGPR